jgi:hypothetical protein
VRLENIERWFHADFPCGTKRSVGGRTFAAEHDLVVCHDRFEFAHRRWRIGIALRWPLDSVSPC